MKISKKDKLFFRRIRLLNLIETNLEELEYDELLNNENFIKIWEGLSEIKRKIMVVEKEIIKNGKRK